METLVKSCWKSESDKTQNGTPCPAGLRHQSLDSQAFTAFGAARVDHGAAATCFHADQETVGASAANFGWLIGAFHFEIPVIEYRKAFYYRKFIQYWQHLSVLSAHSTGTRPFCFSTALIVLWINSG
jgi:hypothetical protein